jgi:iron complex outermembrane receptor protein
MKTLFKHIPGLKLTAYGLLLFSSFSIAQTQPADSTRTTTNPIALEEVTISATRATTKTPVTFSNLSKTEIAKRNLGQDIPQLLNFLPSVVTTSDAGNGFGYTGIRVRGSDATRVNVTINGIPYNDSESSGTYFVDVPDFASSLESIQLQRGVGTSTNGAGAFGASLNLQTGRVSDSASAEIANSYGSFNSRKHSVKFSTGQVNDRFELAGRLSLLHSDGYIDRATSDLKSYFLQGSYIGKTTLIKALVFGGHERTYQAWNGLDAETMAADPRFNYAGIYTDEFGNTRFYENEVDDYQQDHFQLHWSERVSDYWNTNLSLHYTIGNGYYENYKEDADFAEYGLTPVVIGGETVETTDLVRRKWLDNDFYGFTFSANYEKDKLALTIGGGLNNYEGEHFGEVIWARFASTSEPGDHYYDQNAVKTDGNVFTKATYQIAEKWSLFGDLQYRYVDYHTTIDSGAEIDQQFNFFNPKAGVTYFLNNKNSLYFSYARANKEPSRTDFENGSPASEKLDDFELGWRYNSENFKVNTNLYFMDYSDQLVKTGELDEVGNEVHANVPESYRAGIEVDASLKITSALTISPNIAFSNNKIKDYTILTANGLTNFGTTNISFSPNVVGALLASYNITRDFQIGILSKFVGEQYAGNIDTDATKLDSYSVTDFNIVYELKTKTFFKSIVFTGLVNNIFDKQYVSNAYLYGEDYVSYFPQAGINFLGGVTFKF